MGKLIKILIIILVLFYGGFLLVREAGLIEEINFLSTGPCKKPIKYSLGKNDPQFNISLDEVKLLAAEAETFWENSAKRNLFAYDETASFKINLIFDERQMQTIDSEELENNLKNLKTQQENLIKQYGSLSNAYDKKVADYNLQMAEYEKRLKKYNKEVKYWNEQGGAPADEYADLKKESKKLEELFDSLKKQQAEMNSLAAKTNQIATKENRVIEKYNNNIATYKSKYGESREFEKGVFDGESINIYQYKEKADLRLTLIHELGHSLGLNHLENPQSIMYYLMGEQEIDNPVLAPEDLQELKRVCQF
jgi:DNA repair exonuclease SbcCD ATPase subunit